MGSPTEAERSHTEGETPARGAGLKNGPPSFQASAVKGYKVPKYQFAVQFHSLPFYETAPAE